MLLSIVALFLVDVLDFVQAARPAHCDNCLLPEFHPEALAELLSVFCCFLDDVAFARPPCTGQEASKSFTHFGIDSLQIFPEMLFSFSFF